MEKEIAKNENLEQVQEKIKEWLMVLDKVYYVKMTMVAKAIGIHAQNLHNFRKNKRGLSEEKTFLLEKYLVLKYGKLLDLGEIDYAILFK
ncbi:hypothetical protein [Enterococcus sp. DIV0174]|uniref:hypothetical protein n=1 Tax=Enterococcus sp. DIV0174 TaxID=2774785 RepID=UPI003D3013E5